MYYAKNNQVGTAAELPEGAIEISASQYRDALAQMRAGNLVRVVGGELAFDEPEQPGYVYLIDEEGFYVGSSFGAPRDGSCVTFAPPTNLLRPRYVDEAWIEGASADEVEAKRIQDIKDEARKVILARLPDWKQRNLTARALELTEKRASGETLTEEEEAELLNCKAEWAWVKAVRERSDTAERDGEQAADVDWPTFEQVNSLA